MASKELDKSPFSIPEKLIHCITGLVFCLVFPLAAAGEGQESFLSDFVHGQYVLVGKSPGSNDTYHGKVNIVSTENGLVVHRVISGSTIVGSGAIESAGADNTRVLRIRFSENGTDFEETCMVQSDLDNYARITCYLYEPGAPGGNPGLEALFVDHH